MARSQPQSKRKKRRSPDDASRYCSGKVIVLPSCKQSSGDKGGKNLITNNEGGALIIVVKLLRTDTTLDLSQKARVVRISNGRGVGYIGLPALVSCARTM